jgi:beta-xylosidase
MHLISAAFILAASASLAAAAAIPLEILGNKDFPDPAIQFDPNTRQWYVFATQGNGKNVQAASGNDLHGSWTWLDVDLLPTPGKWVNQAAPNIWAPDVHYLNTTDSFVMYYSGLHDGSPYHCIGTATSSNITGPFVAQDTPFVCPLDEGGAIDASGHFDEDDNTRWVVYKVDGSSKGPGGPCGNGDAPGFPTPIRLQQVNATNGVTPIGNYSTILDRDRVLDGPLIEAPNLVKIDNAVGNATFLLLYSSHCYNTPEYDIKYATAGKSSSGT